MCKGKTEIGYFLPTDIKKIFGEYVFPGSSIDKYMTRLYLLLDLLPRDNLNVIVTLTNEELQRNIYSEKYRI